MSVPFINCSTCDARTIAYGLALKTGLCLNCWNKEYCVSWKSPESGHIITMSKQLYEKNPTKYDGYYQDHIRLY